MTPCGGLDLNVAEAGPGEGCLRLKSLQIQANCRSLHFAPPDFLLNLMALVHFMRLSLTERRTRGFVQCCVAVNWLWHSKVAHFGSLFWPTLG
jgi:hypothetical protein